MMFLLHSREDLSLPALFTPALAEFMPGEAVRSWPCCPRRAQSAQELA